MHGSHSVLTHLCLTNMAVTMVCSNMPIWFKHSVTIICQANDPKHSVRVCKGYLTKKKSDGVLYQMTWRKEKYQTGSAHEDSFNT